jgi:hypothetical protein
MKSLRERLVGTWTLVSWTISFEGVEVPVPMGRGATGLLTYNADGYMSVNIMAPDRPKFVSSDFMAGTAIEKAAAFETFIGYSGRYEVDEEEGSVTHKLQTSSYPNWAGTLQRRFIDLTEDRVRLTAPPVLSDGREVIGVLVWHRAK